MYSKFSLSLTETVTVIKMLIYPKLVYLLTVLPTPPRYIFDVIKKIKDFLWKNGIVRICNKQFEKVIGESGLKLTNIKDLIMSWLKRLLTIEGIWQAVFEKYCGIQKQIILELDEKSFMELLKNFQIHSGRMYSRYGVVLKTVPVIKLIS